MALQGSLTDLKLGDVIQTILASSGKGLLIVRGPGHRAVFHLAPDGLHVVEPEVIDEKLVIEGFVRRGALPATIARRARETQGTTLDSLVAVGTLDAAAVRRVLLEAAEEAVLDALGWQQGTFRFDEGAEPDHALGPVARLSLDPGALLLRAAQRIDELKGVHDAIGPNTALLASIDGTAELAGGVGAVAAQVHSHLDGRTLLDEIAIGEGINRFEVSKAGAALVVAGAARIPPPEESGRSRARARRRGTSDRPSRCCASGRPCDRSNPRRASRRRSSPRVRGASTTRSTRSRPRGESR